MNIEQEGKEKQDKNREANHKRLKYREETGLLETCWVGEWAKWMTGIKEDTLGDDLGVVCKR